MAITPEFFRCWINKIIAAIQAIPTGGSSFSSSEELRALITGATLPTGTGAAVFAQQPTLVTPQVNGLKDTNGAFWLVNSLVPSAVNYINVIPAVSGSGPTVTVASSGGNANINLALEPLGTGRVVITNATLSNGAVLGIPASATLTNATGLPVGGITGFGTGIATFLATPTSANLATAVTDETGTGALVFANGSAINPASIGATTRGTGAFSSVTATGNISTSAGDVSASGSVTAGGSIFTTAGNINCADTYGIGFDNRTKFRSSVNGEMRTELNNGSGLGWNVAAQYVSPPQALTSGASVAWNMNAGSIATLTLGTNATLDAPTNIKAGATYMLRVTQDGTGGRTLAYNAVFKWASGVAPTLSTAAGAIDVLTFVSFDGTNLIGVPTYAIG